MTEPPPSPMPQNRYWLLLGGLLLAAAVALFVGIRITDTPTSEGDADPGAVERFVPEPAAEVLRQSELGIDLAPGYDGTIVLNGVEIPEGDQRRVPEQNQVFFTPAEGKAVERLLAGPNCATAIVWKAADGRGTSNDQTFTWCFEAT